MLKLLNSKATKELRDGVLEEAEDTLTQAVDYYVKHFSLANAVSSQRWRVQLQCQVQNSALLLRINGEKYSRMGKERDDSGLTETGEKLIQRSSALLKLIHRVFGSTTLPPRESKSSQAKKAIYEKK